MKEIVCVIPALTYVMQSILALHVFAFIIAQVWLPKIFNFQIIGRYSRVCVYATKAQLHSNNFVQTTKIKMLLLIYKRHCEWDSSRDKIVRLFVEISTGYGEFLNWKWEKNVFLWTLTSDEVVDSSMTLLKAFIIIVFFNIPKNFMIPKCQAQITK